MLEQVHAVGVGDESDAHSVGAFCNAAFDVFGVPGRPPGHNQGQGKAINGIDQFDDVFAGFDVA